MSHDTLPVRHTAPAQAVQPEPVRDAGALRLGGLSPLFPPASVADAGTLRLGGLSPLFARG
jgi:hypothetical protein